MVCMERGVEHDADRVFFFLQVGVAGFSRGALWAHLRIVRASRNYQ